MPKPIQTSHLSKMLSCRPEDFPAESRSSQKDLELSIQGRVYIFANQKAHPTYISWGILWNFEWHTSGERYQNSLGNTVDGPVGLLQCST